MNREIHVWICGSVGVKFPCATRRVPRAHFKYKEGVRNCAKDEGRPLGTGLQEQVSNRLKLRW